MHDDVEIAKQIRGVLHHDFNIDLQKDIYKGVLDSYECMILNFIAIGRECVAMELFNPSIIIFDYEKKIICNKRFDIKYTSGVSDGNTNVRLEIVQVDSHNHLYYTLQPEDHLETTHFDWVEHDIALQDFIDEDYRELVVSVIEHHALRIKVPEIHCRIITHSIYLKTGEWNIHQPYS